MLCAFHLYLECPQLPLVPLPLYIVEKVEWGGGPLLHLQVLGAHQQPQPAHQLGRWQSAGRRGPHVQLWLVKVKLTYIQFANKYSQGKSVFELLWPDSLIWVNGFFLISIIPRGRWLFGPVGSRMAGDWLTAVSALRQRSEQNMVKLEDSVKRGVSSLEPGDLPTWVSTSPTSSWMQWFTHSLRQFWGDWSHGSVVQGCWLGE